MLGTSRPLLNALTLYSLNSGYVFSSIWPLGGAILIKLMYTYPSL